MTVSYGENEYIYGLHDPGGERLLTQEGQAKGWILITEAIGADPADTSGRGDYYKQLADQGFGLIIRLNYSYGPEGTIPIEAKYPTFAQRAANFAENSPGAHIWIIGNEMNGEREQPRLELGANEAEPITPRRYAECYKQVRQAIKSLPGHEDDQVVVGPVAVWNAQTPYEADPQGKYPANQIPGGPDFYPYNGFFGDFILYLRDTLLAIGRENCDAIAIHAYSHGYHPKLVFSNEKMGPPFDNYHYHFRVYKDQLEIIPQEFRNLPVYLTEANGDLDPDGTAWPNQNTGWIKNAYKEINTWNTSGKQRIRCMLLYRWPGYDEWGIERKEQVQQDLMEALAQNYTWTGTTQPRVTQASEPALEEQAVITTVVETEPEDVATLIHKIKENCSTNKDDWEERQKLVIALGKNSPENPQQALEALVERIYEDDDDDIKASAWEAINFTLSVLDKIDVKDRKKYFNLLQKATNSSQFNIALTFLEKTKNKSVTLSQVFKALEHDKWEIRQAAADCLGDSAEDIAKDDQLIEQALNALTKRIYRDDDNDVKESAAEASKKIWNAGWDAKRTTESSHRAIVLNQVLKILEKDVGEGYRDFRQMSADWLGEHARDIAEEDESYVTYRNVANALDGILTQHSIPDELRESVKTAQKELWRFLREHQYTIQKDNLQNGSDEDQKILAILDLANRNTLGSRDALRFLIDTWVKWICQENELQLIELTAEAIRYNRYSVLALIEHFGNKSACRGITTGHSHEPDVKPSSTQESTGDATAPADANDVSVPPISAGSQLENGHLQTTPQLKKHQLLRVDRRIAKQLADMSDPTFFEDDESTPRARARKEEHKHILRELKIHAVPALLRRLPNEEDDTEIREHIVRTLGYVGGREVVDALANQVVSKERMRKDRHDLLSEYYLEPSQERSKQTADILEGAIGESKRTLRILQVLNTAIFLVGLIVLYIGLSVSLRSEEGANRIMGALAAFGGLAGIITLLVKDPLNRIQNAMANLVQVETAFTSFIWSLNLNGTYIQSRYVKNGKLEDREIKETVGRIENAMEKTMNLISMYTEESEQRIVTRINKLEPAAGDANSTLTIYGQHLLGDTSQKHKRDGIVAIDHNPTRIKVKSWNEYQIKFDLPEKTLESTLSQNPQKETVMISLFIDGMETNALPFHVVGETNGSNGSTA